MLGHVLSMDQSRAPHPPAPQDRSKMDTTWEDKTGAPQNNLEKNYRGGAGHHLGPGTGSCERQAQVEIDLCGVALCPTGDEEEYVGS